MSANTTEPTTKRHTSSKRRICTVQIFFRIPKQNAKQFRKEYRVLGDHLIKENRGLINIQLHREVDSEHCWLIYSKWKSKTDFDTARSDDQEFRNFLETWEYLKQPQDIIISVLSKEIKKDNEWKKIVEKLSSTNTLLIITWIVAIIFACIMLALR